MKKIILICVGCLLFGLGVIGIFIPVFPTAPFILAAAACFSLGSEKLYNKLLNSKFFGAYLRNYKDKLGVPLSFKIGTLVFLWGGLIISSIIVRRWYIWLILGIVGIAVTVHLLLLKTKKKEIKPIDNCEKIADEKQNKQDKKQ